MPIVFQGWITAPEEAASLTGYSHFLTPWAGIKASTGTWTRDQSSTQLGGGEWWNTSVQNDVFSHDEYLDTGTFKVANIYRRNTNNPIVSFQLDAVEVGTIDHYGASATNTYAEVTGIAVTVGLKIVSYKNATKNASSSGYTAQHQTLAWPRTGA